TPKSSAWKLTPDKPVPGIAWPEATDTQRVFTGGRSNVIMSATPSPFMLTGIGNDGLLNAFVYNIESKSEFGERITSKTKGKFALSPNGKTFAVIPQGKNSTVTVFSAETGKELYTQDVVEGSPYSSHLVYRSPDELVYIGKGTIEGTSQGIIRILNAQTGKTISSTYDKDFTQPDKCILSPQGRYLIFYGSKFRAFDLANAAFAGEVAIPSSSGVYSCNGLVFNSDGTQLCGLFSGASGLAVLYFDFKNGSILEQVKIPWSSSVMTDSMFYGQPLQFLRDGAYILIEGQLLVEKATQKVVWMLNILPTNDPYRFINSAPRFVAGDRVIVLNGPSDGFQFHDYPVNFDEIIARTQAARSDEPALLKPGSGNVSVVINIDQTRFAEKEQTRQKILEVIGNQLQVMGLTIAENADLALTIDYTEAPGHTLQLRSIGLGSTDQNGKTVQITKFVMKYALKLKDQPVFSRDVTLDPSVMSFRGETNEQAAREQGFEQALNELRGIPLPWYADNSTPPKTLPIVETMQTEGY
ncbi:MAG: WD40 repeat domain-containing protein, partial [Planctomycetaceae bacterium]|nr:WD40 repeat domain-containing protein [Planctomycetaceae bacterium]